MNDDLNACAALVEKGDPVRFRATMAAPVPARRVLFPLYAFNLEVARAPWVTSEPLIAEMRLQWWRDALEEIATGSLVRRHEVVTPLAQILSPEQARDLDELVAARYWDIYKDPFTDTADLTRYLTATSAILTRVAGEALGATDPRALTAFGLATGIANWLTAIPELLSRGRQPLPDMSPEAQRELAQTGLSQLQTARQSPLPKPARPALLSGWLTKTLLTRAAQDPARITAGTLHPSPAKSQFLLVKQAITGRY